MNFATFTNLVTMVFCVAVLVQSVRLMRSLQVVRGGELVRMIATLDQATLQARLVLDNLREVLRIDCPAGMQSMADGKAMLEELVVMTGIANAIAERIVAAASGPALDSNLSAETV